MWSSTLSLWKRSADCEFICFSLLLFHVHYYYSCYVLVCCMFCVMRSLSCSFLVLHQVYGSLVYPLVFVIPSLCVFMFFVFPWLAFFSYGVSLFLFGLHFPSFDYWISSFFLSLVVSSVLESFICLCLYGPFVSFGLSLLLHLFLPLFLSLCRHACLLHCRLFSLYVFYRCSFFTYPVLFMIRWISHFPIIYRFMVVWFSFFRLLCSSYVIV